MGSVSIMTQYTYTSGRVDTVFNNGINSEHTEYE